EWLGLSTELHPDLAALANEPLRLAPGPPPPPEPPPPDPTPAPDFTSYKPAAPVSLGAFDLPLSSSDEREAEPQASEPFDIFAAALQRTSAAPEPSPISVELPPLDAVEPLLTVVEPPPIAVELPPMAFESATIAFA